MTNLGAVLQALSAAGVKYVIVGGAAAVVHGSARLTQDLDIVYARDAENVRRLTVALKPHHPYLRGAPPGLPFILDTDTVLRGLNFTLVTDLGDLDLLGEIVGGGRYENLVSRTIHTEIFGVQALCLDLPSLIEAKRAAGRVKDLEALTELELILRERGGH